MQTGKRSEEPAARPRKRAEADRRHGIALRGGYRVAAAACRAVEGADCFDLRRETLGAVTDAKDTFCVRESLAWA
jgi:hypothetical protein